MCAQFGVVPAKTAASFAGTLLFPGAATSRPRELDAARRNTRVDNIFRVYSRQFSRGGVALIAVVHRGFASSLSLSLAAPLSSSRTRAARRVAPQGLICAQQERHELMHVARAGRESVGSLSRRTPALTRIHHRATLLPSFRPRQDGTFIASERVNKMPREILRSFFFLFFFGGGGEFLLLPRLSSIRRNNFSSRTSFRFVSLFNEWMESFCEEAKTKQSLLKGIAGGREGWMDGRKSERGLTTKLPGVLHGE